MSEPAPPLPTAGAASVERRMASGALWMLLARGTDRIIGLASIVILARLLDPTDFGLVAMATAVVAMLELLGSFGFDVALIQNPNAARRHYDTAWTFNVLFATATVSILLFAAPAAAAFYAEPRLEPVIRFLALAAFIQGFENIGIVAFRKDLRFDKEFTLLFVRRLATFAVTIPLAFYLRSYWALVAGVVLSRVVSVSLSYLMHPYRPRFSLAARGELFHFGKWLAVTTLLNFATTRCADFLVGRLSGARALGLFNMSYEIANLPTSDLMAPINRATFPGYAKKAGDLAALRRSYLDVIGIVAVLAVPAGFGIASIADLIVPVMLGPKWHDAVFPLVLLSFYGVLLVLTSNSHYVYLALGRPRIPVLLGSSQLAIMLPAVAIGSAQLGALGAAGGFLLAQLLFTPVNIMIIRRVLQVRVSELAAVLLRPLLAATVMLAAVRAVVATVDASAHWNSVLGLLALCVTVGALAYAAVIYLLWFLAAKPVAAETQILNFIHGRIAPRVRGAG